MTTIDPSYAVRAFDARLMATTDPRHRVVLGAAREHVRLEAEPVWDLDRLMATLVPQPEYHIWVGGADVGPKGAAAVRAYYAKMIHSGMNAFEMKVDRLVVDDRCVVMEGFSTQLYPGRAAARLGISLDDLTNQCLVKHRTLVVMPVDPDGLLVGEDVYLSGPASWRQVLPGDLPPGFGPAAALQTENDRRRR